MKGTGWIVCQMLTNMKHQFFASQTFETGFSDFHHMIDTILKTQYVKLPPQKLNIEIIEDSTKKISDHAYYRN